MPSRMRRDKSPVLLALAQPRYRFKASDGTTAVDNQDRRAFLEAIDEGTEVMNLAILDL